jgi:hypothetical protein
MIWKMSARSGRHGLWSILAMITLVIASGIWIQPSSLARAESRPGGGGISTNELWVNAQLGQPQGGAAGEAGPLTGRAIRYVRLGGQTPCAAVAYQAPPGIAPWFGAGGNPNLNTEKVAVLSVNRQNPRDQVPLGFGCVNPAVLVQVPTVGEILSILRSQHIPRPVVGVSPGQRGLTGLQTWFWYPGSGDVSVGFGIRGFAITASARATSYRWSTGDGVVLRSGRAGSPAAPAARHTYRTKSSGYPVSLSMVWAGTYAWSGFGDSGSGPLGPVTVTGDIHPYPVAEVRSVLQ